MPETIDEYLEFVQEQIKSFQKNTRLIRDDQIFPETLNRALAEYGNVASMLNAEYQRAKVDQYRVDSEFNDWWDEVVSEARNEILESIEGKKYPAYKEYELVAKERYREKYRAFQDRVYTAERRVSFLRRLIDTYKKQDQILVNLSLNMRSELRTLSLQDRMNANPKRRKARRSANVDPVDDDEVDE